MTTPATCPRSPPCRALAATGALAHAVSIGVTSDESPPEVSAADVVVDGPAGLAALLDALADAIERAAWLSSSSSQVRGVCTAASSRSARGALARSSSGMTARCAARRAPCSMSYGCTGSDRVVQLLVGARLG